MVNSLQRLTVSELIIVHDKKYCYSSKELELGVHPPIGKMLVMFICHYHYANQRTVCW